DDDVERYLWRALLRAGDRPAGGAARSDFAMKHGVVLDAGDVIAEDVAENFGLDVAAGGDPSAVADFGAVVADQVVADIGPGAREQGDSCALAGDLLAQPFANLRPQRAIGDNDVVGNRRRDAVAHDAPAMPLLLSAGDNESIQPGQVGSH